MEKGIVLQLQRDALDENVDVETLLRKAYVVASKLKLEDFKEWVLNEQNGYTGKTPDYRLVKGELKARNLHGRMLPVCFPSNIADEINTMPISEPIATITDLYTSSKNPIYFSCTGAFNEFLNAHTTANNSSFYFETSTSAMKNILSAVRNAILEWSLNLEANGIVGQGLSFSDHEVETAHSVQNINNYTNNFFSAVENSQIVQGNETT